MHPINQIRNKVKIARKNLPADFQLNAAKKIYQQFEQLNLLENKTHIAGYAAIHGEVNTLSFQKKIWDSKKRYYLPIIITHPEKKLTFHPYQPQTKTIKSTYNIVEPVPSIAIPPEKLDLVLVPLVAFDENCHRIGMGQGFYDRTFAFHEKNKKPLLVGLAYDMQKVTAQQANPWDIPLDIIITEKQVYVKT